MSGRGRERGRNREREEGKKKERRELEGQGDGKSPRLLRGQSVPPATNTNTSDSFFHVGTLYTRRCLLLPLQPTVGSIQRAVHDTHVWTRGE